jgi:hypothetical protein
MLTGITVDIACPYRTSTGSFCRNTMTVQYVKEGKRVTDILDRYGCPHATEHDTAPLMAALED